MKKFILPAFILFFLILTLHFVNASDNRHESYTGWKAGVARVVITPEEPIWMAGYAGRNRPAEGTLHDLWAKALVLEDVNGERGVLITTDLIGFDRRVGTKYMSVRIRERLNIKYGLTSSQVILSSSHTHTGPALQRAPSDLLGIEESSGQYSALHLERTRRYSEKLEAQIVNMVGEAINSMEPVKVLSGQGVARFAVNRRVHGSMTTVEELSQELEGPVDHSVPVIKVEKGSGEVLAVVFGYACHSTTIGGYQWSGDYPGFAQIALEEVFPGATAMFFAGAGADQNPLPRRTVGFARQYGITLAAAVERVIFDEDMQQLTPRLTTAYSEIELQFANPPPTKDELLHILDESSGYPEYLKRNARNLLYRLEHDESLMASYPSYPIQFWRIGQQNLVILASEVVIDYAISLKHIFGQDLFVMAFANVMMGYIPSTRVLKEGGYEGSRSPIFTTPWASNIEMEIFLEVIRLAEKTGVTLTE